MSTLADIQLKYVHLASLEELRDLKNMNRTQKRKWWRNNKRRFVAELKTKTRGK